MPTTTLPMRYGRIYPAGLCFALSLAVLGFILDTPQNILAGLLKIISTEDCLITDYIALAGPGAAFINAAIVTVISLTILHHVHDPLNGYTTVEIGLMAGFSLFGKNFLNIIPIIFGTFLYAKIVRKESFTKYASVALLSTSLAPVVSFIAHDNGWGNPAWGTVAGIAIGFLLPPLAIHTYKMQNGMNLYNMGFACGLMATMLVSLMSSMGTKPTTAYYWATGYNLPLGIYMGGLCVILIVGGLFFTGRPAWAAWAGYRRLLKTSGRAPSDFLRMFGASPVLINTGINGLIGIAIILLVGGDLNGPTLGGIMAIMGFSSYGKHAFNIIPIMVGVVLGGIVMSWNLHDSGVQLALLFCTTLAPISGYFGWPYGILAGFLHSSVVLLAGSPVEGMNLYNNGFSGGLVAIVLYPIITAVARHRKPVLQDDDYFEVFEADAPIMPKTRSEED